MTLRSCFARQVGTHARSCFARQVGTHARTQCTWQVRTLSCTPVRLKGGPTRKHLDASAQDTVHANKKHTSGGLRAVWQKCSIAERKQLFILLASGGVLNLGFGVIIPALPVLSQQLGFGATGVGLLLSVPSLARLLVNLPAGAVADHSGRVIAMIVGQLAAAIGCLGTAFADSLLVMLPLRFLGGAGAALGGAGAQAYLVDVTEKVHLRPHRGVIIGAYGGLCAASLVVGPAIGGALTQLYGPTAAFCFVAGLVSACAGAFTYLPETKSQSPPSTCPANSRLAGSSSMLLQAAVNWRILLKNRNQQALCMANVALYLHYAANVSVVPLLASHLFETSVGDIGILFSVGSAIGILLAPAAGRLADHCGRVPLVFPAALTCSIACLTLAWADRWDTFVAAYVLWNMGQSVIAPTLTAYAADISPKSQAGAAMSLMRQAQDLVFLVGPLGLGVIYDISPGPAAMAFTSGLTLVGNLFFHLRASEMAKS